MFEKKPAITISLIALIRLKNGRTLNRWLATHSGYPKIREQIQSMKIIRCHCKPPRRANPAGIRSYCPFCPSRVLYP